MATKQKFYEWTVKIRVSSTWVEDGFNLTDDRVHSMVAHALPYANGVEFETKVVKAPPEDEIAKEQGYKGKDDPRWKAGK